MVEKVICVLIGVGLWGVEFFLSYENGVYFLELFLCLYDMGMVILVGI